MNHYQKNTEDYKSAMGQRIRTCRIQCHLTQEKLSEILDISVKHYSEVERGITGLSVEKLIELSDILGVSLDYLLKGDKTTEGIPCILIETYHSCPENKKSYFLELIRNINKLMINS
ncbi:MAG: helix-turn-helix transcriptional regulator [Lachnospiraceae bacterium]|nr:helix-turn-helix transcriptional regulator [Lachnospiraceae bacterium]